MFKLNLSERILTVLGALSSPNFFPSLRETVSDIYQPAPQKRRGRSRKSSYGANLQHHFDSKRPDLAQRQARHQQYLRDQDNRKAARAAAAAA